MMHRDLKSPNVLLSEEGVAKIADVGMVRAQVKDLVTAQPVMTPLWAAPEVRCFHIPTLLPDMLAWQICWCSAPAAQLQSDMLHLKAFAAELCLKHEHVPLRFHGSARNPSVGNMCAGKQRLL